MTSLATIPAQWTEQLRPIEVSVGKLAITNDASLSAAANLLVTVKTMKDDAEKHREAEKKPFLDGGREVDAKYKPAIDWLKEQEDIVKRAVLDYQDEQERKRRAEQERLNAEAEARRAELLALAESEPDPEDAQDFADQALMVVPDVATTAPARVAMTGGAGLTGRKTWKAEVADIKAFAAFLVEHPDSLYWEILTYDKVKLNQVARMLGNKLVIPGVLVKQEGGLAVHTGKKD